MQLSQIVGGWLYDQVGFTNLIPIRAAFTALCWLLVPFLKLEEIEARAEAEAVVRSATTES